jgi:hypothetical protein
MFQRNGGRILAEELVHGGCDRFHIHVVTAFELEPEVGPAKIRGDKVPEILGTVAVLESYEGLGHCCGCIRYAESLVVTHEQFTINGLDDVRQAIAFAHEPDALQMSLEVLDIAQYSRVLENLAFLRDAFQSEQGIVPGVPLFIGYRRVLGFLGAGTQDVQQGCPVRCVSRRFRRQELGQPRTGRFGQEYQPLA